MMTKHKLKIWESNYKDILDEIKHFEVRKNDRDYQVGDILELNKYRPTDNHNFNIFLTARVTYMIHIPNTDLVVMEFKVIDPLEERNEQ